MALKLVQLGPFTQGEVPEPLLVRVLETRRNGTTAGKVLHGQDPAWRATVHVTGPDGEPAVDGCAIEVLDPAQLTAEYPDDFPAPEDGWLRVQWAPGDLDQVTTPNGDYRVQLRLTNGVQRLMSVDVWVPEVNPGPAATTGVITD